MFSKRVQLLWPPALYGGVKRYLEPSACLSVRLSVPWRSCLSYRHAGCLQLSHRRPPEMCGLRTRPRTDVDPPRVELPSAGGISSLRPRGRYLVIIRLVEGEDGVMLDEARPKLGPKLGPSERWRPGRYRAMENGGLRTARSACRRTATCERRMVSVRVS